MWLIGSDGLSASFRIPKSGLCLIHSFLLSVVKLPEITVCKIANAIGAVRNSAKCLFQMIVGQCRVVVRVADG